MFRTSAPSLTSPARVQGAMMRSQPPDESRHGGAWRRHLPGAGRRVAATVRTLLERNRALTVFGLAMLAAMVPTLFALGLDARELRGVSVWAKPLKFLAALGLFALTMAWFTGYVDAAQRRARAVRVTTWLLVGTAGFEIAYITFQAALGQASHFNVTTPFHAFMYSLMGIGALLLTATAPLLAWQIARHPERTIDPVLREGAVIGLALTFVLGAGVGMVLGGMQPPAGPGLALVGWSTVAGDLRPAHFFGIHAQQIVPLAAFAALLIAPIRARALLRGFAVAYSGFTVAVFVQALAGQPLIAL
ncbi:MAG: hypothetical protein JSW68_08795 [Burkholderiales bacterium]|nr:MAG: hypothetical protein JSW68_08795 [Burkholderiales bacterium]